MNIQKVHVRFENKIRNTQLEFINLFEFFFFAFLRFIEFFEINKFIILRPKREIL